MKKSLLLAAALAGVAFGSWAKAPQHVQSSYFEVFAYYEETNASGETYVVEEKTAHIFSETARGGMRHHTRVTRYRTDFTCVPNSVFVLMGTNDLEANIVKAPPADKPAAADKWLEAQPACIAPRHIERVAQALPESDRAAFRQKARPRCASPACANPTEKDVLPPLEKGK